MTAMMLISKMLLEKNIQNLNSSNHIFEHLGLEDLIFGEQPSMGESLLDMVHVRSTNLKGQTHPIVDQNWCLGCEFKLGTLPGLIEFCKSILCTPILRG